MSDKQKSTPATGTSRRDFIKTSSMLVAGGAVAGQPASRDRHHSFGIRRHQDRLSRLRRAVEPGAAIQAMNTTGGEVRLVAKCRRSSRTACRVRFAASRASTRTRLT
ncbi:MAG: twin-arginine translocation signal domain-containing protein [Pirellulaceae bacterium]